MTHTTILLTGASSGIGRATASLLLEQGYRVIYEPQAILMEPTLSTKEDEYSMRVRVSLRAFWALYDMLGNVNEWVQSW